MNIDCRIVKIPTVVDERGALAALECNQQIPFQVQREFHLYNLKRGVPRGGHAHKSCHQFIVSMAGSFEIVTRSRMGNNFWLLDSPESGLYVPPCNWVELVPTIEGSVLSVLASDQFNEMDYIRDWELFMSGGW